MVRFEPTFIGDRKKTGEPFADQTRHNMAPIITHSLTHNPKADYYCFYCRVKGVYCDPCRKMLQKDYEYDQAAGYYADYYSRYYAHYYSKYYADRFTQDYFVKTRRTKVWKKKKGERTRREVGPQPDRA